jgi:hypothetical protein
MTVQGKSTFGSIVSIAGKRGVVVVVALRYKRGGRALGPGVYSTSNRNEYQTQKNGSWVQERCRRLRLKTHRQL